MGRVVHKINASSWAEINPFSDAKCGVYKGRGSIRWKGVTCKKCLKQKRQSSKGSDNG